MRDYGASARDRLLALAREQGQDFQLLLIRYACERFLYRLSVSEYRDLCFLKGASLLGLWMADPYRSTRDLDLLTRGQSDAESVGKFVASICLVDCPEDGIVFDPETLRIEEIRTEAEYGGQRAMVDARLAQAVIHLQIDLGFGDAVEPVAEDYPVLLQGLPAPRLLAYPREYVVAEKFEAMLKLGRGNSRMKDFHDIWALSRAFRFEMPALATAVSSCLAQRGSDMTSEIPDALRLVFYEDDSLQSRWNAYRMKGAFYSPPPTAFSVIGSALGDFLSPVREAIIVGEWPPSVWVPGGPWK